MSVLIKGMEVPKNCFGCPCYHQKVDYGYYDYEICGASGTIFNDGYSSITGHKVHINPFKERLDNCPLIPVPPHGRLIDADDVILQIDEWMDSVGTVMIGPGMSYYGELLGCVEDAQTVIPANDKDTDVPTRGEGE